MNNLALNGEHIYIKENMTHLKDHQYCLVTDKWEALAAKLSTIESSIGQIKGTVEENLVQSKKTNGRVSKLELWWDRFKVLFIVLILVNPIIFGSLYIQKNQSQLPPQAVEVVSTISDLTHASHMYYTNLVSNTDMHQKIKDIVK